MAWNMVRQASKKRGGAFGKIVDAKDASARGVRKRRDLAKEWSQQVDLFGLCRKFADEFKRPTLERVAKALNSHKITTRFGKEWTKDSLYQQLVRLGIKRPIKFLRESN